MGRVIPKALSDGRVIFAEPWREPPEHPIPEINKNYSHGILA